MSGSVNSASLRSGVTSVLCTKYEGDRDAVLIEAQLQVAAPLIPPCSNSPRGAT